MKQVININFQGRVVPIEVTAFEVLKDYTDSLSRHFAAEEGKEEIINDIENRIGELFQERLKEGATCITDADVNAIIKSMGRPEEFDEAQSTSGAGFSEGASAGSFAATDYNAAFRARRLYRDENNKFLGGVCSGIANYFGIDVVIVRVLFIIFVGVSLLPYLILWIAVPSSASTVIGSTRKKLYRDPDTKIIGGICSGIGHYFGVNPWIPRALFLLPLISIASSWDMWGGNDFWLGFSPGSLIIYIILWLVIPEASTTAEKLEMKGEKVDMNSIKNSVMEEMKGVHERAQRLGKEARMAAQERSKTFGSEVGGAAKRGSRSLGDIIVFLFKAFAYLIIGLIALTLVITLFAFGIAAIGLFPMKDFVLNDGWQDVFAWGTLLFFIAVPIIGIITWIIRRIAKVRSNSRTMRFTFFSLWFIGIICFASLLFSVGREFKASNNINEEEITLSNPLVSKLEVRNTTPDEKYYRKRSFRFEPFANIDDTASLPNISVHLVKSPNDSFRVTMLKMVNGPNRNAANRLASLMQFNVQQQDSLLIMDKGISINKTDKFRNQRVVITVYVPVGKQIKVNRNVGWSGNVTFGPWDGDFDIDYGDVEDGWDTDVTYVMREDGLYDLDGEPANSWKRHNRNEINNEQPEYSDDNYRYDSSAPVQRIDSLRLKLNQEKQRIEDSLKKAIEKTQRELERIKINSRTEPTAMLNNFPTYNPIMIMY